MITETCICFGTLVVKVIDCNCGYFWIGGGCAICYNFRGRSVLCYNFPLPRGFKGGNVSLGVGFEVENRKSKIEIILPHRRTSPDHK